MTRRPGYALEIPPESLDLVRFERLRRQGEAALARGVDFLRAKRRHDPEERFQSEWYRHHRSMFADAL